MALILHPLQYLSSVIERLCFSVDPFISASSNFRCFFFRVVVVICTLWPGCNALADSGSVEEPDGYRVENYDAPVPERLSGATLANAFDVQRLLQSHDAVVIDVIPEHRKPDFLPENQIWIPPAHEGVSGAIWLPDIGYGVLSAVTTKYFKDNLEKFTGLNKDHPVVFYCRMDCWMSWNAAKRALSYSYTNIYWFSYGIDGWKFEEFELQTLTAEPGVRQ